MVELNIRQPVRGEERPDPAEIPALQPGAMAESKPYPASADHQLLIESRRPTAKPKVAGRVVASQDPLIALTSIVRQAG